MTDPDGWDPFLAGEQLGDDACGPAPGDTVLVRGLLDAKNATLYNHRIGVVSALVGDGSRLAIRFAPDVPAVSIRQGNLVLIPRCPNCLAGIGQRSYCASCHFGLHTDGGAFALARPSLTGTAPSPLAGRPAGLAHTCPNAFPLSDNDFPDYMMADHIGLRPPGANGTTQSNFVATDSPMEESPPAPLAGARAAGYCSSQYYSKDFSSASAPSCAALTTSTRSGESAPRAVAGLPAVLWS
jgi:hypothetical protein